MTDRSLSVESHTVASLVPMMAPSLAPSLTTSMARGGGHTPILAQHEPESLVAFGSAGSRTAERLLVDVARIVAVLPEADPSDTREILCVASDRYHFTVALLAAWQRGHKVALPPNAQPELLRRLAEEPSISLVIHDADELTGLDLRPLLGEENRATAPEPIVLAPMPAARTVASVWTSGSTGEHQRHPKTAGQLFGEALVLVEHFGIARGTRIVATVPSHHIYGLLFAVLVPLVGGGSFLRDTPLHAGVVRAALESTHADVLVSVPAHLRALGILDRGQLPPLARVFSSGAALPPATAHMLWDRYGLRITEVLGSTETGGIAWRIHGAPARPLDELPELPELPEEEEAVGDAAAWTPLPHVHVSVDAQGQLGVDSPFLPPGGARPRITADRVELLEPAEGEDPDRPRFRHFGRVDGVVKVGGKRVALAEIERRLLELPGVEDAAVTAVEVEGARGRETVAVVVAPGLSIEHIKSELRRWLDPVVIPRRIRLVDALPREANGKLTRKRLLELLDQPKPPVRMLEYRALPCEQGEAPSRIGFSIYVPRDLVALRGHFRSFPIVPGVVQLELARELACARWSELGGLRRVLRLKFVRPLRPGERAELWLERRKPGSVEFVLASDPNTPISSGTLEFGQA